LSEIKKMVNQKMILLRILVTYSLILIKRL